jgi:membrane fusion protein (multidrug efflux system)
MRAHSARATLALAAAALFWAGCGRGEAPPTPPPEVVVARARTGSVPDRREYVGQVRAVKEVDVRARVRGYLVDRLFVEGAAVAEGEVLFRIDTSAYDVALAEARGRLGEAQAAAERSERDLARAQELRSQNVVSASVLDARRAERDAAAAEVSSARAAVAAAELDLSWCTVRAPIAGRIGLARVDVGSLVGESGQDTVLARIVQVDPVHVHFSPPELEPLHGGSGAPDVAVELRLGDGTPYPERGRVDFVDPTVDPTRGTVTARALVANPAGILRPGQFVRVVAVLPDVPDAVLVPERAVVEEQGGSYVLVVKPDDEVEYRRVRAGASHAGLRRIAEGLAAGERVVVEGVQKARPGTRVAPREAGVAGSATGAGDRSR